MAKGKTGQMVAQAAAAYQAQQARPAQQPPPPTVPTAPVRSGGGFGGILRALGLTTPQQVLRAGLAATLGFVAGT